MEIKNFTITKRDGSKERFSLDKIMSAIIKAFNSVNEPADLGCISKIIANLDIILYVSDHLHKTKGTQDVIIANTRHHSSIRQTIHRQPHWHNCGDMSDEECNIRRH